MNILRYFTPAVNTGILIVLITLVIYGVLYMGYRIGWINAIDYIESLNMENIATK